MIVLASTQSTKISLEAIRCGKAGLNEHRAVLLNHVPLPGNWDIFDAEHLTMKDLAYLTAQTGHEFAILRGKHEDILFHGTATRCEFPDKLIDWLLSGKVQIFGHSHPGEEFPVPSPQDRATLARIGQQESRLISGMTGLEITFTTDPFEGLL